MGGGAGLDRLMFREEEEEGKGLVYKTIMANGIWQGVGSK